MTHEEAAPRGAARGHAVASLLAVLLLAAPVVACTSAGAGQGASASDGGASLAALKSPSPGNPTAAAMQASLDALRAAYLAPGALAVVIDGDGRTSAVSGVLRRDGPAVVDTARFRIGSITKPIVAALTLISIDRRELGLDAVVADVLPGVLRRDPAVTIRQLLDHTSGVFDEGNEGNVQTDIARLPDAALRSEATSLFARYAKGEAVVAPAKLLVALAETHDRYFAPGTGYHYSNINYQLLGMILERITGQPLDVLLRTRIVEPLGLHVTTLAPADRTSPDLRGYDTTATGAMVDLTDDLALYGNGGNGGIMSSADELLAILRAIVTGRLFASTLVGEMERPVRESYGLGLGTATFGCGSFFGHGGSVSGTQSIAEISPDGRRGVVVAINLKAPSDPGLPKLAETALCGG